MGDGAVLLQQLELILEADKLIDEVGFLHPSQFTTLGDGDEEPGEPPEAESGDAFCPVEYDETVFWLRNHKLAISAHALSKLYIASRHTFMTAGRSYRAYVGFPGKGVDSRITNEGEKSDQVLESEVLMHTKAVLILSCNFTSAWNCRKLVLSRKNDLSLLLDELQFSALILSYSPKCESAWSQRRWVIKTMAENFYELQHIVVQESELVQKTAEKAKMNYRAWSHQGWLVSYMRSTQVLDELAKWRKWAELHIADNCCFHYRRRLMLRLLADSQNKQNVETSGDCSIYAYSLWKEELDWNELLIRRYIGREALWTHRRFLAQCWISHFINNEKEVTTYLGNKLNVTPTIEDFLSKELQLLNSCLSISADEFNEAQVQAQLAAAYYLWISKFPMLRDYKHQKSIMPGNLKALLLKACPESILYRGCFPD